MADTGNYNVADVLVSYSAIPLSGWADDVLVIEPVKEDATVLEGPSGDIIFCDTNSTLVKVTLAFMYGTASPKALEAVRLLGLGPAPFIIADTNNTVLCTIAQAKITKRPTIGLKAQPDALVYEIQGLVSFGFFA